MINRRRLLEAAAGTAAAGAWILAAGCRGHQFAHVIADDQTDLVGTHAAGAATLNPLIDEAVGRLLARQEVVFPVVSHAGGPPAARRVCFVGVENRSAEELGDFKEQIYEQIDTRILASPLFHPVSRRFVAAGLRESRLRPDELFLPDGMRQFAAILERQGQPFDYLLFARLTSGTTQSNRDYQRDYVLSLELIDVHSGDYDKESATIRKGYHRTRLGKWRKFNIFTRG